VIFYVRFPRVSFSFGAPLMLLSSTSIDIGGLVARGLGAYAGRVALSAPGDMALSAGGEANPPYDGALDMFTPPAAAADGVSGGGALGELNSAQRGHLRFVSAKECWFCAARYVIYTA
jgi:hypothetical protein